MSLPAPSATTTAIVTGASSGIGADIARELADRRYGVTLVARRKNRLRDLAEELSKKVRVEIVACDVADAKQRARLFDTVAERGLEIDILVNNAGIGTVGPVINTDVDAEIAQVRVNVEAVIDLTTRAVQQMVPRGRGAVLNVGSGSGFMPTPGQAGYAGTKAFTYIYGEGLRGELAGTGVTIATLAPGPVRTEFLTAAGVDDNTLEMPKFMYMNSRDVARIGIDAIDKDRGTVVPGWPTRILTRIAQIVPNRILVPVLARQMPGHSGPHK
jgi:uncharacterized protein